MFNCENKIQIYTLRHFVHENSFILYNVCPKYAFIVAEMGKDCSSRPYSRVDTHTLIYSPDKIHCTSHFLTLAAILIFFAGLFTLSSEEKGKNSCVQVFWPFRRSKWNLAGIITCHTPPPLAWTNPSTVHQLQDTSYTHISIDNKACNIYKS